MKATIIHHQGFGDLFTCNAMCNYYSKKYDELIVLVHDESRKKVVDNMYKHIKNIKCEIPPFRGGYNGVDGCINCHTPGNTNYCPRGGVACQYVDYSKYEGYEHIKSGCFKGNYHEWCNLMEGNQERGYSFSHSFYEYEGLDLDIRTSEFSVYRDIELETKKFVDLNTNQYVVVHDDRNRGMGIYLNNPCIYNLNGISELMIDQITILENAKEIHFIDSSYSVLIYFLSFHNEKIKKIPKFLHKSVMNSGRDMTIYDNKTPYNWYNV